MIDYAVILIIERKFEEAEIKLKAALALEPRNAFFLSTYAETLRQEGKLDEAAVKYQEALAIEPKSEFALMGYAAVLMGLRRFEEASGLYYELFERDQDNMLVLKCYRIAVSEDGSEEIISPFALYVK